MKLLTEVREVASTVAPADIESAESAFPAPHETRSRIDNIAGIILCILQNYL